MQSESSFPLRKSFVIVCAAILLSVVFCAQATAYDWALQAKACSSTGAASGDTITLGTSPGYSEPTPWFGDPGCAYVGILYGGRFCRTDIRHTIPPVPGRLATWDLHVWVDSTYPYNNVQLRLWTIADLKPWMSYWVEIMNDPTGTYAPGTRYYFGATHIPSYSPVVAFSWSSGATEVLKTSDVEMKLVAYVTPEPSGAFALASGLLGLTLCIRRKRR